jgi:hypothetical protein
MTARHEREVNASGTCLHLVLYVFIPALLFEGAWNAELDTLEDDWQPIVLLVIPGMVLYLLVVAIALHFGIGLAWLLVLLVGAIVVSTVSRIVEQLWTAAVCAAPNQSSFPSVPSKFQEAMDSGAVQEGIQTGTCPGGPTRAPPP